MLSGMSAHITESDALERIGFRVFRTILPAYIRIQLRVQPRSEGLDVSVNFP
jgi:hypothetical protein